MMLRRCGVTAFLVCVLVVGAALGIGCGEPLQGLPEDQCTDWQCTRNVSGYCVRGLAAGFPCNDTHDCYLNLQCSESSTGNYSCVAAPAQTQNVGVGLVGAVLGVLCFGSSFVPIKKYKRFAGDGVFAQFLMNFGRFGVGIIILFTRENRWFYWEAAIGGAIWSLGNALGVPIVQCIGVGLGVSIWGCTNMLLGWASGHFGLLGVRQEIASRPALEYTSVAFSMASILLFIFVKPVQQLQHKHQKPDEGEVAESQSDASPTGAEKAPLIDDKSMSSISNAPTTKSLTQSLPAGGTATGSRVSMAETLGAHRARVLGVGMALVAGCLFGICMDPAQRLMSNFDTLSLTENTKVSPYGLDYVFSNNCGALFMSSILLITHSILHAFRLVPFEKYFDPVDHGKLIIPAIAAGAIGSCGSAAWFFANQNLGLIVSFPIIAAGPGVVSSLWGAVVFKEIRGTQNFIVLGLAFACVISAGVTSSLSK